MIYIYIFVFFITAFEIIVFTTDSWNKFPGLFVPRPPIDLENSNLHVLAFWRTVFFSIHHDANCCWPERFELMFILGSLCSLAWWSSYYNIVNTMISGLWKLQYLGTIIISGWYYTSILVEWSVWSAFKFLLRPQRLSEQTVRHCLSQRIWEKQWHQKTCVVSWKCSNNLINLTTLNGL